MSDTKEVNFVKEIERLTQNGIRQFTAQDGHSIFALPEGMKLEHEPDSTWEQPEGICVSPTFQHPDSFISYVNEFKTGKTKIFANPDTNRITGYIDYHAPEDPDFLKHDPMLKLVTTTEFDQWNKINGELIEQEAFAEFLEEHGQDILEPDSATMIEIATQLQVMDNVSFQSKMSLKDGKTKFQYVKDIETQTDRGEIEIPGKIVLGIPIYLGQDKGFKVPCFFRFRLFNKVLKFKVQIENLDRIKRRAFEDVCREISEKVDLEILIGSVY